VTAYIDEDDRFVTLVSDSTEGRPTRANRINALRRRLEAERGVKLNLISRSYSETWGFLSRSQFRYERYIPRHASGNVVSGPSDWVGRH
jgi:hypothetical protein